MKIWAELSHRGFIGIMSYAKTGKNEFREGWFLPFDTNLDTGLDTFTGMSKIACKLELQ